MRLIVKDDGPDIPDADRDRLFEPVHTNHRAAGGTGLGLTLTCWRLEAHGETIALADQQARVASAVVGPT